MECKKNAVDHRQQPGRGPQDASAPAPDSHAATGLAKGTRRAQSSDSVVFPRTCTQISGSQRRCHKGDSTEKGKSPPQMTGSTNRKNGFTGLGQNSWKDWEKISAKQIAEEGPATYDRTDGRVIRHYHGAENNPDEIPPRAQLKSWEDVGRAMRNGSLVLHI